MQILVPTNWGDYDSNAVSSSAYALLDSGDGQRLERFGPFTLVRPDPQIIWKPGLPKSQWAKADAVFEKTSGDNGRWIKKTSIPEKWLCTYQNLSFWVKLTPFKHTGIFPEQAVQWDFLKQQITDSKINQPNVLNLFGYTGIASLMSAQAGAKVTHIDASYPTIGWAKENQTASGLNEKPIRWILDDCLKFVNREIKRGVKYDGIIMDPPIYGHGPNGEIWNFNESFPRLLELCSQILSNDPLFIIINAYAISSSAITLQNVLEGFTKPLGGTLECGELALKEAHTNRLLSTGIFARWSK